MNRPFALAIAFAMLLAGLAVDVQPQGGSPQAGGLTTLPAIAEGTASWELEEESSNSSPALLDEPRAVVLSELMPSDGNGTAVMNGDRRIIQLAAGTDPWDAARSAMADGASVVDVLVSPFPALVVQGAFDCTLLGTAFENEHADAVSSACLSDTTELVGATELWERTLPSGDRNEGDGVVIAVIDTGVWYLHHDLGGGFGPGYKVIGGYDFVNNDDDPLDDNGHGTHCAGIAAADGNLRGVAPHASILAYKALDASGYGYTSYIIKAIGAAMDPDGDPATDDAADVISLSLGASGYPGDPVSLAAEKAVAAGIVVVAAAGNKGPSYSTIISPGLSPAVITVGATDKSDALYTASSRGPTLVPEGKPDIAAPGVNINSTAPPVGQYSSETGYRTLTGTSMATPHVAGAAALLLQANPALAPGQVKALLCQRARPLPLNPLQVGAGRLQVNASAHALAYVEADADAPFPASVGVDILGPGGITAVRASATLERFLDANLQAAAGGHPVALTEDLGVVQHDIRMSTSAALPDAAAVDEGYYSLVVSAQDSAGTSRCVRTLFAVSVVRISLVDGGSRLADSYLTFWMYRNGSFLTSSGMPAYGRTVLTGSGPVRVVAVGGYAFWSQSKPYLLSADVDLSRGEENIIDLDLAEAQETLISMRGKWGEPAALETLALVFEQNISGEMQTVTASAMAVAGTGRPSSWMPALSVMCGGPVESPSVLVKAVSFGEANDYVEANHGVQPDGSTGDYGLTPSCYGTASYMMRFPLDGAKGVDLSRGAWLRTGHQIPGTIGDPWYTGSQPMLGGGKTEFSIELTPFAQVVTQSPFLWRDVFTNTPYAGRYYPGDLALGMFEIEMYTPDWENATLAEGSILVPGVSAPPDGFAGESDVGGAPFSPGGWLAIVDGEAAVEHPLLRDSGGSRVISASAPVVDVRKGGAKLYKMELSEYWWTPAPRRLLSGASGDLTLVADVYLEGWSPSSVRLGASFDTAAGLPPMISGISATQRWEPGDAVELSFVVEGTGVPAAKAGMAGGWIPLVCTQTDGRWVCQFDAPHSGAVSFNISVSGPSGSSFINETDAMTPAIALDAWLETPVEAYDPALAHAIPYSGGLEYEGAQVWPGVWIPLTLRSSGEPVGFILDGEWLAGGRVLGASRDGSFVIPASMFNGSWGTVEYGAESGPYSSSAGELSIFNLDGAAGMLTLDSIETEAGVAESFITLMNSGLAERTVGLELECGPGLSAQCDEPPERLGDDPDWSGRLSLLMTETPIAGSVRKLFATGRTDGMVTDVHEISVQEPLYAYERLEGRTHERFATSLAMSDLGLLVGDFSGALRCLPVREGQNEFDVFDTGEYWLLGLDTADLDGDGDLDLATGDWEGEVEVYRNGDNWWTPAGKVADTTGIANLAFGDFDGDGAPDVAVSDLMGNLAIYRNLGNFSFSQWASIDTDENFGHFNNQGLEAGDIDGDGNCDIVKGYYGQAALYLGDGAGSFTRSVLYDQPLGQLMGISTGDIDGDGMIDLALSYFADSGGREGRVFALMNEGNSTFQPTGTLWQGQGCWAVLLCDVDEDGDDDIWFGDDTGKVHALECGSMFAPARPSLILETPRALEPGLHEIDVRTWSANTLSSIRVLMEDASGNRTLEAALSSGNWRNGLWSVPVWANDSFRIQVVATDAMGREWTMSGGWRDYAVAWDAPAILSLVLSPRSPGNCTVLWVVDADDGWLELTLTADEGIQAWSGWAGARGSHVFENASGNLTLEAVLTDAHGGTASAARVATFVWDAAEEHAEEPAAQEPEESPPPSGIYIPV